MNPSSALRRGLSASGRRSLSSRAKGPRDVVILSAARTPVGSFQGALASATAPELGAAAVREAVSRSGVGEGAVQELFMGNVVSSNLGQAPARQVTIKAGLGWHVPSTAVNKVCASGMKASMLAAQTVMTGMNEVAVAGGMESMSNVPYYLGAARQGMRLGHAQAADGILRDALTDVYDDVHMGMCAEHCNQKYGFSREQQDEVALESYRRAAAAWEAGHFREEVVPFTVRGRRGKETVVDTDEEFTRIQPDKVASLRPVFKKDGSVTAANASTLNDGASALVLASREYADAHGLKPLARIAGFADYAHEAIEFPAAPGKAVPIALKRAGLELSDIDYFEANEAFATINLLMNQQLGIAFDKLNVWGSGISLGHPVGSSGSRIMVTLLSVLKQRDASLGVAAICNGGGGASAVVLERE